MTACEIILTDNTEPVKKFFREGDSTKRASRTTEAGTTPQMLIGIATALLRLIKRIVSVCRRRNKSFRRWYTLNTRLQPVCAACAARFARHPCIVNAGWVCYNWKRETRRTNAGERDKA